MIWFFVFTGICYILLIVALVIGYYKVNEFYFETKNPVTTFSVIIPFRNEEHNLPKLLASILLLEYPKHLVEFIFVDDDSTDNSQSIINRTLESLDFTLINNERKSSSPKKDAITTGIANTKKTWIITTDADCELPKKWLQCIDSFIQKHDSKMIVAPVNYRVKNNLFEQFQLLDFISLQATTIGGFGINFPFLCNGANLIYQKEIFTKLNGFEGNNFIASGDDIFLMQKILQEDKNAVTYLKNKDAIVTTFPVRTNMELLNQRIRWAAKTSNYNSWKIKAIGFIVFFGNLSVLIPILFSESLLLIITTICVKLLVDSFLIFPAMSFFNQKKSKQWYFVSGLIYPSFIVIIALLSIFKRYTWKERVFKK